MLPPLSPVRELIYPLSSGPLRLAETSRAMPRTSEGVTESDKVAPEKYIKSVNVALAIELLVSRTRNPLAIFKAKHGKPILPFKIGFIAAIHVILSISNKDINIM